MRRRLISIVIISIIITILGAFYVFSESAFSQPMRRSRGRCGDSICDEKERINSDLCPKDCETSVIPPATTPPDSPKFELQPVINETKISPQDGRYKRPEAIEINNRIFAAFNNLNARTFQLVELNEDLSYNGPIMDIFSDSPSRTPTDIRLASDGENLWYAFESVLPDRQGKPSCDNHFLNMAKYSISGAKPELIASKTDIARGCSTTIRGYANPPANIPENPEAVDDPTPIFHNGKYVILTRAWKGSVQHIRTFDKDFNLVEDFTLDLGPVIGDKKLSQNALVNIDGQIYLIGVLGSGAPVNPNSRSGIYAISLSDDLHSVSSNIIPLVKHPDEYYMKTTTAIYDNGKLYINYVKAGNGGQLQHLGVFDVKNGFALLAQVQVQDESLDIPNHASFAVSGNRVYALYQGESDDRVPVILGKVFEWQK